jgi:hypothetical protein
MKTATGTSAIRIASKEKCDDPVSKKFTLDDFDDKQYQTLKRTQDPLGKFAEEFVEVDHIFLGNDFDAFEERLSFHNYYGPTVWIIADVFKKRDACDYSFTAAINKQYEIAQQANPDLLTGEPLQHMVIKNIINKPSADYLGEKARQLEGLDLAGFFEKKTQLGYAIGSLLGSNNLRATKAVWDGQNLTLTLAAAL